MPAPLSERMAGRLAIVREIGTNDPDLNAAKVSLGMLRELGTDLRLRVPTAFLRLGSVAAAAIVFKSASVELQLTVTPRVEPGPTSSHGQTASFPHAAKEAAKKQMGKTMKKKRRVDDPTSDDDENDSNYDEHASTIGESSVAGGSHTMDILDASDIDEDFDSTSWNIAKKKWKSDEYVRAQNTSVYAQDADSPIPHFMLSLTQSHLLSKVMMHMRKNMRKKIPSGSHGLLHLLYRLLRTFRLSYPKSRALIQAGIYVFHTSFAQHYHTPMMQQLNTMQQNMGQMRTNVEALNTQFQTMTTNYNNLHNDYQTMSTNYTTLHNDYQTLQQEFHDFSSHMYGVFPRPPPPPGYMPYPYYPLAPPPVDE
ncbi:hypothetical protein PR202_gb25530 [Eleusine coracana subsp. coracana]|uniref:Uncharacterized protein n=1 Tax=Eleusine coracana subsp. coracana TaxID=191504 RepID=A0AAV5FPH8_ELECO|nr:hypothetical protein PR202_gb25530 [Eleusine coracana subsp. coracana]